MKTKLALLFSFILCFGMFQLTAFAEQLPNYGAQPAANQDAWIFFEQQEGQYRYEFADGTGFATNVKQNEQNAVVATFQFDSSLSWNAFCDGNEITYENNKMLDTPGSYTFKVHGKDNKEGIFSFKVNEITSVNQLEGLMKSKNDSNSSSEIDKLFSFANQVKNFSLKMSLTPNKEFAYAFPSGAVFYASVPNGAVTTQAVRLVYSEQLVVNMMHNDIQTKYKSGDEITEPGAYHFEISALPSMQEAQGDTNTYTADYYAYISPSVQNNLGIINAPVGFTVNRVKLDGNDLDIGSKNSVVLGKDGNYQIEFTAQTESDNILYRVVLKTDTAAPFLTLSGGAECGYSDTAVYYKTQNSEDTVAVFRNGSPYLYKDSLNENGMYVITVKDTAGNARRYTVRIDNINAHTVNTPILLSTVVLVLIFGGYLLYIRRHSRVI